MVVGTGSPVLVGSWADGSTTGEPAVLVSTASGVVVTGGSGSGVGDAVVGLVVVTGATAEVEAGVHQPVVPSTDTPEV
ncbi:hypothetical protein AB0G02_41130 [Actinosynnema sp. NPDC023658]|uniref:hypothetical protein n=1 Tax=Actinosynnema sp. NPDC023658 TaxID=3155465 RepID=UPI0033FFFA35